MNSVLRAPISIVPLNCNNQYDLSPNMRVLTFSHHRVIHVCSSLNSLSIRFDQLPIDYTGMPWAVFSYPQVAGVGETEEQLQARGAHYVKGVVPYSKSAMGMALRSDSGLVKLMVERGTRKLLGCFIVGHEASVLIHEVRSQAVSDVFFPLCMRVRKRAFLCVVILRPPAHSQMQVRASDFGTRPHCPHIHMTFLFA